MSEIRYTSPVPSGSLAPGGFRVTSTTGGGTGSPSVQLAGTNPTGKIFRSTNNGVDWTSLGQTSIRVGSHIFYRSLYLVMV